MNKKALSETDIRTKFITPAIVGEDSAGWDLMSQVRKTVKWDPEILFHSPMLQLPVLMSQLIQF